MIRKFTQTRRRRRKRAPSSSWSSSSMYLFFPFLHLPVDWSCWSIDLSINQLRLYKVHQKRRKWCFLTLGVVIDVPKTETLIHLSYDDYHQNPSIPNPAVQNACKLVNKFTREKTKTERHSFSWSYSMYTISGFFFQQILSFFLTRDLGKCLLIEFFFFLQNRENLGFLFNEKSFIEVEIILFWFKKKKWNLAKNPNHWF